MALVNVMELIGSPFSSVAFFGAQMGSKARPAVILGHENYDSESEVAVTHPLDVEIAERDVETLHVIEPFVDVHVRRAAVSHDLPFYSPGETGVPQLVERTQVLPCSFCILNVP